MSKDFTRHDSHKMKRLSTKWRKPRGLDNKLRKEMGGFGKKVKIGYGTKSKDAVESVSNISDLNNAAKKKINVYFASSLGKRKRVELLKKAIELKVKVLNVPENYIEKIDVELKKRKEAKSARSKKKEEKKKELDKKAKEKEKEQPLESKLSDQEKKDIEKQEKDALLTRKEGM